MASSARVLPGRRLRSIRSLRCWDWSVCWSVSRLSCRGAIDSARREEVLPYLERLRDNLSIPMVYVSHQFDEVLRLATHVVLMDAGHVVAHGSLSEVSLVPQLRAIVGPDSVGAVVDGVVTNASGGMAELSEGSGSLNVSVGAVHAGDHVRVQLLARDIILATEEPRGLSVRNQLRGMITGMAEG